VLHRLVAPFLLALKKGNRVPTWDDSCNCACWYVHVKCCCLCHEKATQLFRRTSKKDTVA
jgi:hypothetical protein